MKIENIFANVNHFAQTEIFEQLLVNAHFKLERIISTGQATPPDQWYDQTQAEWVILLSGSAGLLFEGEQTLHLLKPGDYLYIPAHQRHRVEWTDTSQPTVWLALNFLEK